MKMKKVVLFVSYLFMICSGAFAVEIKVPGDYPTIQEAIDLAEYGDDVIVDAGIYNESIVMKDEVDVIGAGADVTTIQSNERAVQGASLCTLSGFKLLGKNYGVYCDNIVSFNILDITMDPLPETGWGYSSVIGIYLYTCTNVVIDNCTIGNLTESAWGYAAGISVYNSSDVTILKNRIYKVHDNAWSSGFGIYVYSSSDVKLLNNLIYYITGTSWGAAYGIYNNGSSNTIINNIVNYLRADGWWGTTMGIYNSGASSKISNNVVYNCIYGIYEIGTDNDISYNNTWLVSVPYYGPVSGPDNINVNPLFAGGADPSIADYYILQPGSPCIDAGDPDPGYNDLDGTRNDMGLFGGSFTYIPPEKADVLVFVYSNQARPGFDMEYTIIYHNRGSRIAKKVRVQQVLPKEINFLSCNPLYDKMTVVNGQVRLRWDIGDLVPGEGGIIKVDINVPSTVPLGTILNSRALIRTASQEDIITNNLYLHSITVVGSYDPNDKGVTPQGFIKGDENLYYVIHYENEGTAEAINITIKDTLSEYLADSTLIGISNNGSYDSETRTITWTLQNINLPPEGTGAIFFIIKPVEGLVSGTEIRNKASIIFDYNPPMDTPETVIIIGTEEQFELQEIARNLVWTMEEMEIVLIDMVPDPEIYFNILDAGIEAAWQAFDKINKAELPWKAFNECQEKLIEFKKLLMEQGVNELPVELVNEWISKIENELIPGIVNIYPPEPIADAGEDKIIEAEGLLTSVTFDGSGSYDPNPAENIESYTWYNEYDEVIGTGINPVIELAIGAYQFTLVVNDGEVNSLIINNETADDSVVIINIIDTTPPKVDAGEDITEEANCTGGAAVTLSVPDVQDIVDPNPEIVITGKKDVYPLGSTIITVTATDASGNSASDEIVVTVTDTTPPDISVNVNPNSLWPPDHKMVDIVANVTVSDICDAVPEIILLSVVSNEPDNGLGDGNTSNDIQGADLGTEDYSFSLRAERSGNGDGRVYTITYTVTDASGNAAGATATVTVPHDQD